MKIVEKAWKISAENLCDPWYYNEIYVYAENRGKARSKGLDKMLNENAEVESGSYVEVLRYRDVEYTDIKAHRCKEEDKVEYNGEVMSRSRVEEAQWCDRRDNEAIELMYKYPNGIAVVYAGCYGTYWGANRAGYFSTLVGAGKYSTKEAYEIVKNSSYSRQEVVKLLAIEEYNSDIDKEIKELENKIVKLENKKL